MFKYYAPNPLGRDFVCGDIHGCYTLLEEKLASIEFDKDKDRLFSTGDLADRGPESEKALDYIRKDWFIPVMGNHEDMVLQCWRDKIAPRSWHYQNGGDWLTMMEGSWVQAYIEEIEKLPLVIQVGNFGIIHSRIPEGVSWIDLISNVEAYRECILWERNERINSAWTDGISGIFAGHTIHENIVNYGNTLDIDTGAFLSYWEGESGKLTIIEMDHS